MNGNSIRTFLGANSAEGFVSLYDAFTEDDRTIVIKGGPGSGKSSVMKKIAAEAVKRGMFVEYCYCSSDAESLDAIRIPERSLCVLDGTPPHVREPQFPGAKDEIFYTGQFWNGDKLRDRETEIRELSKKIKECFARTYRYLCAAGKGMEDLRAQTLHRVQTYKLRIYAERLTKRHIGRGKGSSVIRPRFLSAVSPQGTVVHKDTVYTLADRVYVLEDRCYVSDLFLESVLQTAEDWGQEIYVFFNPLFPSMPEHVVFPRDGVAFVTSNKIHAFEPLQAHRIHLDRFLDQSDWDRKRSSHAERLISENLKQASHTLGREKALHDDLEDFYVDAMDFKKLNQQTIKLIKTLF